MRQVLNLKKLAAARALEAVSSGMSLGLGSGSTNAIFVELLGEAIQSGRLTGIRAVPTSNVTAQHAQRLGIPLATLQELPELDLAVDGADEVDPDLNLIKGLGKALLREKIVEVHARKLLIIVDESKLVPQLGLRGPLPVEIVPFESGAHVRWLNSLGCRAELWHDENNRPWVTDNHNFLARCWFARGILDVYALARQLESRPGIVEHGLFLDMAHQVIVAGVDQIKLLERTH